MLHSRRSCKYCQKQKCVGFYNEILGTNTISGVRCRNTTICTNQSFWSFVSAVVAFAHCGNSKILSSATMKRFYVKFEFFYISFSYCLFSYVCVLRGRVITSHLEPIVGVRVSHYDHLEEGFTLTRPDGHFDFVCNCNSSTFVKLKFGRSPFPFIEKQFHASRNQVSF